MSSNEPVCIDCDNAKTVAEAKASATTASDGLNLGGCKDIYNQWADCIEKSGAGTGAKECKSMMDDFRKCHSANAAPQQRRS